MSSTSAGQSYMTTSKKTPAFLSVITATVCDVSPPVLSKSYQHILLTATVGLHGRSQEMSLVQYLVGFMLKHGGCTERVTIIFFSMNFL